MPERTLRVCALYPTLMNIYADRGNLLLLERRCAWRGIGFSLLGAGLGDPLTGEEELPGVGLLDARTVRIDGPRLIGNVAIEVELDPGSRQVLAGFENHGGRTHLGPSGAPLGRVLRGHGNNGRDQLEGARRANVIGTYLHGPLLPKNAWFADWLIATALGCDGPLAALDDDLELAAHAEASRAAGIAAGLGLNR